MLERIKNGAKPTDILREIVAVNPGLGSHELSRKFCGPLAKISMDAVQSIWYWAGCGRVGGFDDEELDEILLKALKEEGYI